MPSTPLTSQHNSVQSVVATKLARAIFAGFEAMFAQFLNITLGNMSQYRQQDNLLGQSDSFLSVLDQVSQLANLDHCPLGILQTAQTRFRRSGSFALCRRR